MELKNIELKKFFSYFNVFLSFILCFFFVILLLREEIINIKISNHRKNFKIYLTSLVKNMDTKNFVEFKNKHNIEKIVFLTDKGIEITSEISDYNEKFEFKQNMIKKNRKGFFKNAGKIIYFFEVKDKGYIFIYENEFYNAEINSYLIIYIKYLFILVTFLFVIFAIKIKIKFINPVNVMKSYFINSPSTFDFNYYEKKIPLVGTKILMELASLMNNFIDKAKRKYKILEEENETLKKSYELLKIKDSQLDSILNFSYLLSNNESLEEIYKKIDETIIGKMGAEILVIMLKDKDYEVLDVVHCKGIKYYKNLKIDSIEKKVVKNGKVLKVKEALKNPGIDFSEMDKIDSVKLNEFYIVPLKCEKSIKGVIIVDKIFNSKLKPVEEIITLSKIGEIAGYAIDRTIRYREMNIGLNVASILYKITTLVEAKKDLYEIFREIIKSIKKVVDYTSAALYLVNENNELENTPEYREGENDEILESIEFKLGKGIKALAAQKRDTIIIEDISKTAKSLEKIFNEKIDRISSFACVPMLSEGKLIGVINLTHKEANKFVEEDKKILKLFANQAAVTIEKIMKDRKIEELISRLKNETITDMLTEIYNRRYMMQRLEEESNRAIREKIVMGLLAIDIDFFKKFNDTFGHQVGDMVLKKVALIIKNNIRVIDIPCRYGGEEFFVILPNTTADGLKITAERIRRAVEKDYLEIDGKNVNITISIGASKFPEDASSIEDLIKKADMALYKAKETGRNRVVIYGKYQ